MSFARFYRAIRCQRLRFDLDTAHLFEDSWVNKLPIDVEGGGFLGIRPETSKPVSLGLNPWSPERGGETKRKQEEQR